MTGGRLLDEGQRAVVLVAPEERQVVVAPPGAGKTETAAALVGHLLVEENVDPEALLVVSFSRAAVHAIDARLEGVESPLPDVRTLDSLARRVVAESDGDLAGTFDQVVAEAVRCLQSDSWEAVQDIEHLVVDEVQDIVGARAELLLLLLDRMDERAGWTLLGDPAQAIYDFQLRGAPAGSSTADSVMTTVAARDGVTVHRLDGSYRGRTTSVRQAVALRNGHRDDLSDAVSVDEHVEDLVDVGDLSSLAALITRWRGRTAVLTSNNGQALLVHRELSSWGLSPRLRRPVGTAGLAPWPAVLLGGLTSRTLDRGDFDAALAGVTPAVRDRRWVALRRLSRARSSTIDVGDLVMRLRASTVYPPDLLDEDDATLVVSTVHRSKGLEFDNVVVVRDKRPRSDPHDTPGYRRRVSYVALTRARDTVAQVRGVDTWNLRKEAGRWVRTGGKTWQTTGFEIGEGDVAPGSTRPDVGADAAYIAERVRPGDAVDLSLDRRRSTLEVPVYAVSHDGTRIAETSLDFGEAMSRRLKPASRRSGLPWPGLSGARVAAVETVLGEPVPGTVARWGAWSGATLVGMLDLDWKG